MYIKRHIEPTIKKALNQSKVVLVTGARQVGKTFIIEDVCKKHCKSFFQKSFFFLLQNRLGAFAAR